MKFFSGVIAGTVTDDYVQMAKEVINGLPYGECTFSVQHNYGGQRYVHGYTYMDKAYGSVTIQKYNGVTVIVDLVYGVYNVRS